MKRIQLVTMVTGIAALMAVAGIIPGDAGRMKAHAQSVPTGCGTVFNSSGPECSNIVTVGGFQGDPQPGLIEVYTVNATLCPIFVAPQPDTITAEVRHFGQNSLIGTVTLLRGANGVYSGAFASCDLSGIFFRITTAGTGGFPILSAQAILGCTHFPCGG